MKPWIKFGVFNAIAGFLVGLYIAASATGEGYWIFAIAAPLAAFITAGFFWKHLINPRVHCSPGRVVLVGVLTGTVSHYVAFVLLSIGQNVCFWTTGGCTGSLGDPPASILFMLTGAFAFTFFSLMVLGWITVSVSIVVGLLMRNRDKMA